MNMSDGANSVVKEENSEMVVYMWKFWLEGTLIPLVGGVGVSGNSVMLHIILKHDLGLKPLFRELIILLLISDSLCVILSVLLFSVPRWFDGYYLSYAPILIPFLLPLDEIALTMSVYATVGVAVERWFSVCKPHFKYPDHTGFFIIFGLILGSILLNITRFLEYETVERVYVSRSLDENSLSTVVNRTVYLPEPTDFRMDPTYSKVSTIVSLFVLHLVPLCALVCLNRAIFSAIRARCLRMSTMTSRQRRDLTVAASLAIIVLVFLICHSFKCFINLVELFAVIQNEDPDKYWGPAMSVVVAVSHFLIILNCSTNFIIYCYKDQKFRDIVSNSCRTVYLPW